MRLAEAIMVLFDNTDPGVIGIHSEDSAIYYEHDRDSLERKMPRRLKSSGALIGADSRYFFVTDLLSDGWELYRTGDMSMEWAEVQEHLVAGKKLRWSEWADRWYISRASANSNFIVLTRDDSTHTYFTPLLSMFTDAKWSVVAEDVAVVEEEEADGWLLRAG